ncbi:MAG: putative manganese transporter [Bacteroidales bacterium]|nr:putative manganese transporter [Bacteroidales bacterium]MCL2132765.1 putative manganese transporter [Bacteroidales bacterium]
MELITDVLKNAFLITGLVMVMMLLIEYFNIQSNGRMFSRLERSPFGQVLLGALLGLIPGCIGGFALVSLFTHRIVSFGALIAMMIAATGDEAFILLAVIPKTALLLNLVLFLLAIVVGLLVDRFVKRFPTPFTQQHFVLHEHEGCAHSGSVKINFRKIAHNLRHISFERALLLFGLLLFVLSMLFGLLEHDHAAHVHGETCDHGHHHEAMNFLFSERWMNVLFGLLSIVVMALITVVDQHFLEEHLWGHIIKKHFLRIFLWTLGALLFIQLFLQYFDVTEWISDNPLPILLAAVLIGIIPESGPHIIFITLFASGHIPFSVLLASSISQNGHTTLPLLAESKRGFLSAKLLCAVIALVVGLIGLVLGY